MVEGHVAFVTEEIPALFETAGGVTTSAPIYWAIAKLGDSTLAHVSVLYASPQRGTVYSGESTDVQVSDGEWVFRELCLLPHLTCHLQVGSGEAPVRLSPSFAEEDSEEWPVECGESWG